jgi:hypothetical protein
MSKGAPAHKHAVIDGSNLATEGRKEPSLSQLDEAVRAISAEYKFSQITVIVDATFEHRVATSETKAARKAIDDNDILTPPAGVIGRGDAFILQVADRADAVVFSNDSFQEFHGTYKWLFDEGRLIGGKPVPGVGWIYVARSPVRGPVSRRATAEGRRAEKPKAEATSDATPASRTRSRSRTGNRKAADASTEAETKPTTRTKKPATPPPTTTTRRSAPKATAASEGSNDPATWKTFKADFPVGSTIAAQVDRFSSHGAYGSVDDVVVYLPNRLLGDPPPTKARDVIDLGSTVDFVIHRYDDERYGVDAGLVPVPGGARSTPRPAERAAARSTPARKAPAKRTAAKKAPARKSAAKKAPAKKTTAKKAPARKSTAKKTAKKAPSTRTAATRTPAKKATARTATKKAAAKKAPARKSAAKSATKKTTANKRVTRR